MPEFKVCAARIAAGAEDAADEDRERAWWSSATAWRARAWSRRSSRATPAPSTSPCSATSPTATTTGSCCPACSPARTIRRTSSSIRSRGTTQMNVTLHAGVRVRAHRSRRAARHRRRRSRSSRYDALVIATGSSAFVPPLDGLVTDTRRYRDGVFVFRTLDDCAAIRAAAHGARRSRGHRRRAARPRSGARPAPARRRRARRPPDAPPDGGPARRSRGRHAPRGDGAPRRDDASVAPRPPRCSATRRVTGLMFDDGSRLECDMVVVSAGIRPERRSGARRRPVGRARHRRRRRPAHGERFVDLRDRRVRAASRPGLRPRRAAVGAGAGARRPADRRERARRLPRLARVHQAQGDGRRSRGDGRQGAGDRATKSCTTPSRRAASTRR